MVLVGNSLGGYNCLKASVTSPDLVRGVVLLNSAGRFEEVKAEVEAQVEAALPDSEASDNLKEALREVRLFFRHSLCHMYPLHLRSGRF